MLLSALAPDVRRGVAGDDVANPIREALPRRQVSHQIEAGPDVVGHRDVLRDLVQLEALDDGERILLGIDLAGLHRLEDLVGRGRDRLGPEGPERIANDRPWRHAHADA